MLFYRGKFSSSGLCSKHEMRNMRSKPMPVGMMMRGTRRAACIGEAVIDDETYLSSAAKGLVIF